LLAAAQRGEATNVHAHALESAERELFRQAIDLAHGNQAKAARWLGVSRITMKAKTGAVWLSSRHGKRCRRLKQSTQ